MGGPRLPPEKKAPRATQPAAVSGPASWAAGRVARRFSSLGFRSHFSAASRADVAFGEEDSLAPARAHWMAHHTASGLGRA